MAISQLQFGVCVDCSSNKYSVTDTSSGSPYSVTAETFTITYPGDDSFTFNLKSRQFSLSDNSLVFSPLASTSVSMSFDVQDSTRYLAFIVYTDSNGDLVNGSIGFTSDASATSQEIGDSFVSGAAATSSLTGVTATYDDTTGLVTFSGSSFGICVVNISGTTNQNIQSVTPGLIQDGKYAFSWSLTVLEPITGSVTYNASSESYFLCNVECCVRGKMSTIDVDCDCTGDKATDAAIESMLMLQGIKAAAACGKDAKADKLLVGLQAICNNDCKSC